MLSSSSSLLYAYDADVDVRALKVVLDLDVGIRVLEEPWKAILGILVSSFFVGALEGRPRYSYLSSSSSLLLIELSDIIIEL